MWQRFTERARKAVFYAQEEAQKFGEGYVSTEHLLLGLLREPENVATRVLEKLGLTAERVREAVAAHLPQEGGIHPTGMTLTPVAKRVVDLAYHEAREELNNNYIGTEHLLLGLLREPDGIGGRVLRELGVELADARREVRALQAAVPREVAKPKPPPSWDEHHGESARVAVAAAKAVAQTTGAEFVSTEHLLIGILADAESLRVLEAMGIEPGRLLKELKERTEPTEPVSSRDRAFSINARLALDLAGPESTQLGCDFIGTPHLLLGLVREGSGLAGKALAQLGFDLDNARLAVEALQVDESRRNPAPAPKVEENKVMWQRFTERARKAVFYAQEEAQKFGEGYVSTEHLLLGLVREPDSLAARVLEALGVSLIRVRVEVEKQLPRGDARPSQDMTLTPRAKRVIDLAYDEARNLNNNYIGTEHLLLGLVREGDGLAGRVLHKLGVELESARREVMSLQAGEERPRMEASDVAPRATPPPADPWARFDEASKRAVVAAEDEALRRGQTYRSPEHLLLALLAEPEYPSVRALVALGLDVPALRAATEGRCRTAAPREGEAPLSQASNHAFVLAYKEGILLRASMTGTEHLLLGLLREPDGVAGRVLDEFGLTLTSLREAIRGLEPAE